MPGLDGTRDGIAVALLKKVQSLFQDSTKLAVLNSLLALDTDTSFLIDPAYGGPVTASMVKLGDGDIGQWDISTGAFRFMVCSGDFHRGNVFTNQIEFISEGGTSKVYTTSVFGLIQMDATRQTDTDVQSRSVEIARGRLLDWMMWVLEWFQDPTHTNLALTLDSHYYDSGGDQVFKSYARMGAKGLFSRGFGDSYSLYGVHLTHQAELQGSMI